ncbi:hypothetical protein B5X24_HaOG212350 [Helicoverpa armigera]|nr:hypothetical protein B5X24_HaOG212350 [Helicoverpa armigera]
MSPKKKKKAKDECEADPPLPRCKPPPDICKESGLTPAENAMCAERKRNALKTPPPTIKKLCPKKNKNPSSAQPENPPC